MLRSSAVVAESGFVGFESAEVAGLEEEDFGFFGAFAAMSWSGARSASVSVSFLSPAQERGDVQGLTERSRWVEWSGRGARGCDRRRGCRLACSAKLKLGLDVGHDATMKLNESLMDSSVVCCVIMTEDCYEEKMELRSVRNCSSTCRCPWQPMEKVKGSFLSWTQDPEREILRPTPQKCNFRSRNPQTLCAVN